VSVKVRPCADLDEFGQAVFAIGQYFALDPTPERMERFSRNLPIERTHAAFEGGKIVGGAGAFPFEMTVPGGVVRTAGVTVVGTTPTHRRQGVLRSMMRAQLDDVHERGEPVAALWASEETIYGRFGYGMASIAGEVELAREYASFAQPLHREGTIRFVEVDEALRLFPRVWSAVRRRVPGMLARSRNWWEHRILFEPPGGGEGPKRLVVLESNGKPEGYAIYRHKPKWEHGVPAGRLEVVEAIALDGRPTAELWRFLLNIDWSAIISAELLPTDHQLFFLLAHPRRLRYRASDGLWVRLVDVGEALSSRAYATDGTVVIDVSDEFCPWNAGRWRVADGSARRTRAAAHLRCDVTALGSVYLGAFGFSELVRAGRVEELRRGAAARADAMFRWAARPGVPRSSEVRWRGDSRSETCLVVAVDARRERALTHRHTPLRRRPRERPFSCP
jgi:predicted acetyltransferase